MENGSQGQLAVRMVDTSDLDEKTILLARSIKLAGKARDFALTNVTCDRHARAIEELSATIEHSDELHARCNLIVKYRKLPNGNAVTCADLDELQEQADTMSAGLLADVRTARCHAPRKSASSSA